MLMRLGRRSNGLRNWRYYRLNASSDLRAMIGEGGGRGFETGTSVTEPKDYIYLTCIGTSIYILYIYTYIYCVDVFGYRRIVIIASSTHRPRPPCERCKSSLTSVLIHDRSRTRIYSTNIPLCIDYIYIHVVYTHKRLTHTLETLRLFFTELRIIFVCMRVLYTYIYYIGVYSIRACVYRAYILYYILYTVYWELR